MVEIIPDGQNYPVVRYCKNRGREGNLPLTEAKKKKKKNTEVHVACQAPSESR